MTRLKDHKRRTASSRAWLTRQISDPYVMRARREGLRSRAAYKLAEIDDRHKVLKAGAVDAIRKGVDPKELLARLRDAQRFRGRRRFLQS